MSSATYGLENAYPGSAKRTAPMQRPLQVFVAAGDFFLILMSYFGASVIYGTFSTHVSEGDVSGGAGLIVGVVFIFIGYLQGIYDNHRLLNVMWQLRKAAINWMVSLTILAIAAFLLKSTAHLSRGTIILFAVIGMVSLWGHRAAWRVGFASPFAKGHFIDRRVVLLSMRTLDFTSSRFKDLRKSGFDVVRHFVLSSSLDEAAWDREIQDIIRQSRATDVDEYLVAVDWNELPMLQKLSQHLRVVPQPIRLLPDFPIADLVARPFVPVGGTMAIEIQRPPLSIFERAQKRCLDVGLASLALLLLAPLLLATSILIKLDSPGKLIFRQSRGSPSMPLVEGQFFLGTASTSLSLSLKTGRSGPGPALPFCENRLNSGPAQFVTHPFASSDIRESVRESVRESDSRMGFINATTASVARTMTPSPIFPRQVREARDSTLRVARRIPFNQIITLPNA